MTAQKKSQIESDKHCVNSRILLQCFFCKTSYNVRSSLKTKSKFCSKLCFYASCKISGHFTKQNNPNWKQGKIQKNCLNCNNAFETYFSTSKTGRGKYCSVQCRIDSTKNSIPWNKGKKLHYQVWNKGKKYDQTECATRKSGVEKHVACKICEKQFKTTPSNLQRGRGKYCSRKCFYRGRLVDVQRQQNSKNPTSIERIFYDFLFKKNIVFEKQHLINDKFLVDAYIPSLNLIIEADGKYWHSLPRVVKKDRAENAYLQKCGFNLLRLTEMEINNGSFVNRLEALLHG